jgi:hypothetical protein
MILFFQEERDLSHLSFGADPLPENVHIGLGFEGTVFSICLQMHRE